MCPMTACGARQMSMLSRQLFKAIQASQPVSGGSSGKSPAFEEASVIPSLVHRGCHGRAGEAPTRSAARSLCVSLVYVRIPARLLLIYEPSCEAGKKILPFPMCHAARSLSPSFFFLAFEFDHAGTRWKVRTEEAGGQAGSSGRRLRGVGLVTRSGARSHWFEAI